MAQLKDLIVSGPTRLLNDLYVQNSIQVTTGIKIGSANELKSFGTGLSINSSGVLSCTVAGTITGSGTSGYLTKWNGGSSITNGPQLGSSTTTYLRNDGSWATPPNTTYTLGTGTKTVTLTPSSGSAQSITVPYATSARNDDGNNQISTTYGHSLLLSGGQLSLEDGNGDEISGSGVTIPGWRPVSPRDFTNGTLIKTSINYAVSEGTAFYLHILSDGYGTADIDTVATGYIYSSSYLYATGVTNYGRQILPELKAMNIGGNLCFWFARIGYWQSFACECYSASSGNYNSNLVTEVSNSADPSSSATKVVVLGTGGSSPKGINKSVFASSAESQTTNYLTKWSAGNTIADAAAYDTAASNSTIAQRTANGYLYATYFNNSNSAVNIASYTVRGINFTSSDGFIRNTSKANFTSWLGLGELAYLSAASGNEGKYLSYDGSSEYSWSGVNSLTGWSALSSTTAVNDFMTGNTLKFAEVKSYTTATLDGNDGVLLSVGYPGTTNGYGMQILMDDNNAKTTIYARGRKATNYDTWRKIAHSGNLTLSISSNNLSLKVDGTTVSTVTLPNTCLAEGTKILMANHTEKNVEDVVAGDSILSYDPNTNQLIEAIVVGNYETGVSDDFVNYYFDDGSFVTIFGKHCLYSATEGTARGVDFWEPGWEGINDKGETIAYIGSEDVHNAGRKRHFDLHSSNKLYYANGILNAQSLTLDYPQYKSSDLPQSFITALKQDFDSSANLNTFKFDRKVGAKLVPLLKEMKQQRKLMDDNKKLLADTDYIVAKFTEGLINTVEWLKAKADRANWRSLVNKAEEAYATAKARYDTYKQQYAPTNTKRERFNAAVARDNACLEELKAYYKSKN